MKILKNELTILKNLNFPPTTEIGVDYKGHVAVLRVVSKNIGQQPINLRLLSELVCLTIQETSTNSIESLPNTLTFLDVCKNSLTSIDFLSQTPKLDYLYLDTNQIVDLSPISAFSHLKLLSIAFNPITDFSPLTCLSADILFVSGDQNPLLPPLPNIKNTALWSFV